MPIFSRHSALERNNHMPARDSYHDTVVRALQEDGWTITADPFWLAYGDRDLYVDLAAEEAALAAEKSGRKIAIEIKSFIGPSPMRELELALGQFVLYRGVLAIVDPERRLYMAVPDDIYASLFASQFGQLAIRESGLSLCTFEVATERIVQWIN
jgi:XisH protein